MEELEADKIPNVPHPRKNKKIYGHNSAKGLFLKSLNTEKLHHAWLIHGPKGVGKATLAWKIVKLLQNGFKTFEKKSIFYEIILGYPNVNYVHHFQLLGILLLCRLNNS